MFEIINHTIIISYNKVHINLQHNGLIVMPPPSPHFALCRAFTVFISYPGFCVFKHSKAQWSLYVPYSGHYMYHTVVTICTTQWSLYVPPNGHCRYRTVVTICTASGHYMYRTVVTICTASVQYMYRQFNIQQFYVQPTQCIYVFCVDLRTNSDYFPRQH